MMNLTEPQKALLTAIVDVYTHGCHRPFIFVENTSGGASLIYPEGRSVPVDATPSDVVRLEREGLIDSESNSQGLLRGRPSANGIVLAQRNFIVETPVFPDIKPTSIKRSQFFVILNEDMDGEDAVNALMVQMFHAEGSFYFFQEVETPAAPDLQAAVHRGDIVDEIDERLFYRHPNIPRDFIQIKGAEVGRFNWDWERAVAAKGPEFVRRTLRLSGRKKREMESLERIHLEMAYRRRILEEQNRTHVFLSYASADHEEAELIREAIEQAGGTVFLDKKDLDPGEDFAERIREALHSCKELWLLVSPSSLGSEWVITEWGAAWVLQKTIVPILHRCDPDKLPARLRRLQCIDMHKYRELVAKKFSGADSSGGTAPRAD